MQTRGMDTSRTGPESIGERLRRLRLERKQSQRELASPGVSYAYISRIEAGARRPSVKALRQLARKLGVSVEYLETGSDLRDVDERELRLADAELDLRLANDPAKAEGTLRTILDEAVAAGDTAGALRANVALGLVAAHTGHNSEAVERLEPVAESRSLSPARRPDIYATLGQSYAALGQPRRAVELFERCLAEVTEEAPDDFASQVRFATYLSYACSDLGDFERAEAVIDDALAQAADVSDPYTRVRLYWSLARLNELRGESAVALDYARRAIALLEVTDDTVHLARAHLLCGSIMTMQGKVEDAGAQFDAAEQLFGTRPEPLDLGNLRTDQAKRAVLLGRPEEAEQLVREAVDALGGEQPTERGVALGVLAEALAQQGKSDAEGAFEEAAKLLDEHGRHFERSNIYRAWARYLRKAGRESEALDVLDRAAQLSSTSRAQV
jgi:transcriptional regulator with XRE-family HTH domain